ncbi:MAG TPA: hypothetical protein VNX68_14625, partial [Nitrosopumilaceae archaeon]|nr:hypothetical protein [Nitrosopumilaceae archaeon]
MQKSAEFNVFELFDGIETVNRKIAQNYCCNFSGYHRDMHDIALTYSYFFTKLFSEANEMMKVHDFFMDFLKKQQALYNRIFINHPNRSDSKGMNGTFISPQKSDKRFIAPEWSKYPNFDFIKQSYLLAGELASQIIDEVEMGEPIKKKLHFYMEQYLDMLCPANFIFTNPEILELTIKTKGENLVRGFSNLIQDIEKGRISQINESAFEIGKNIAITPGNVIYENELIQLIQYGSSTQKKHQLPLLIIPSWINKYYILDLQPENSFVKFLVDRGFIVCMISW